MNNFRRISSKIPETVNRKSEESEWRLLFAFLLVFAVAFTSPVYAQLVGFPIGPTQPTSPVKNARTSAVSLPFFDDFSLVTNGRLDPALWQTGGGTYVSNTITINHPTLNVVTFDGSDAAGRPYNFVTQSAQGSADTLTSQPIDLSVVSPNDSSVYLSFYVQLRGLGELPDSTDFLYLSFLNDAGVWQKVWQKEGGLPNDNFIYEKIAILGKEYLHANFQFRFQAITRLSGQFDMWHIDYVYLNKGRRIADQFVQDVAVRLPVSSFLKRYTAMPLKQYLVNPTAETADSVTTDIYNLNTTFNFTTFSYTLRDEISGRTFQNFQQSTSEYIKELVKQPKSLKPTAITGVDTSAVKKLSLVSHFQILTTDNVNPSIPGVDLRRNDSISGKTVLADYYAYDDGTAETAVYFNRSLGRTAVRYFLNTPDFVSGVRMNIVSTLKDLTGQSMTLQVWSNSNGKPQSLLYQKAFKVQYPVNRNEFVEFPFDFGVAVRDTFYVGWLQIGQDGVPVGLDRNNQHENQIFINAGQEWVPYTNFKNDPNLAYFQGSLLVRPIMGAKKGTPVTSVEPEQVLDWEVYPNPTTGQVRWHTDQIRQVEVYQLNGVLLKQQSVQSSENTLDLSGFADGLYFLRLSNEKKTVTKKILLRK
jgi:hypothetical protein